MALYTTKKLASLEPLGDAVKVLSYEEIKKLNPKPLRIGLLNLMPSAVVERTELQFARLLAGTGYDIQFVPFYFDVHKSHSKDAYMQEFYEKMADIKREGLDGLISTGANLEQISFEEVEYWKEFLSFIEWARENIRSIIFSCWSAHAALRHFYGVEPVMNKDKQFGIFLHTVNQESGSPLAEGMDDQIYLPHSRWRGEDAAKIRAVKDLEILVESPDVGPHVIVGRKGKEVYIQGHPEYDRDDIRGEYLRDKEKGMNINKPMHYFQNDDETKLPIKTWAANGQIFYTNWVKMLSR